MGLFSVTTRADGIVLTANIWNTDHNTIVTHTEPTSENSFETTLAQMQLQSNPAPGGVVTLPAALSNELQQLRYTLALLKSLISSGTFPAFWYTTVASYSGSIGLPMIAIRREITVTYGIPNNIVTTLTFDTTVYDTGNYGALLTAPVTGTYAVGAVVAFGDGASSGGDGDFLLTLNRVDPTASTTFAIGSERDDTNAIAGPKALCARTVAKFTAGQQLAVAVSQSSGSTKNLTVDTNARPAVWMALIGL